MFGVVPRPLWEKKNQPDSRNRCLFAMRSLLISEGDRLILVDTGLGDKQDEKFFSFVDPHGPKLLDSLSAAGVVPEDITDVLFTHLHFDHSGGAVRRDGDRYAPVFPNARHWSNKKHWDWAMEPSPRDRGSFLKENYQPLEQAGMMHWLEDGEELIPGLEVKCFHGHTESMLIPHIKHKGKTLVFMADMQPSLAHLPISWVMAYDLRPLTTISERTEFLKDAVDKDYVLMFEHDAFHECCTLKSEEVKGQTRLSEDQIFRLEDW